MKTSLFPGDDTVIVYTDGGSRGNPGQAAFGVVIQTDTGTKTYAERIGIATNNIAEYSGIAFALKKLRALLGKKRAKETAVEIRMDSELAERQLNGKYKVENEEIQKLFMQIWNLRLDFGRVDFTHIRREANTEADRLVNQALDGRL
jgi:ribonuclease HI